MTRSIDNRTLLFSKSKFVIQEVDKLIDLRCRLLQ